MGRTAGQEPVDNSSDPDQPGHPVPPTTEEVATVKMLHVAWVPARHSKLVRVTVADRNVASGSTLFFEPNLSQLHQKGITMSDALIDNEKASTMIVHNQGVEPVILDQGYLMGYAHSTNVMALLKDEDDEQRCSVKAIQASGRMEQLWKKFNLREVSLHQKDQVKLKELVEEYR